MKRLMLRIVLVLAVTCCTQQLLAWNDAGHLTVAKIAYERLTDRQRHAVAKLLRHHPHRDSILLKDRPEDVSEEEWIFLRAAVWSDHVRPPRNLPSNQITTHPLHKFHRGPWHYVNYPYHVGQTESELPARPVAGDGANATNILEQLEVSMKVLKGDTAADTDRVTDITDDENRAVRLCWLFHLMGDLHQPLHVTTLIDDKKFPKGTHADLGGNLIVIRSHIGAPPHKLHGFWDDRLGTDSHFPAVKSLAEMLTHDPHLKPEQLPEFGTHHDFKHWAAESYAAAKTTAYRDGQLSFALSGDLDQKRITNDDVPILPQGAEYAANKLARRRVTLAGYRLAELLKQIVGE
ncbi:MAG: S1/P1 nuclease [Planctomycetia bacterium]|nr:S1/P1 nuclease [Planctomycetia bacterium]